MAYRVDVTGKRYGNLVVESFHSVRKETTIWKCRCDCGKVKIANKKNLQEGITTHCGCKRNSKKTNIDLILAAKVGGRGVRHGMSSTPTYVTWSSMLQRCYSKNHKKYLSYGGKGVVVCDRWRCSFLLFLEDMGLRPEGTTLDRIDGTKGYYKENCRWANKDVQDRNRVNRKYIIVNGKELTAREYSAEYGMPLYEVYRKLSKGKLDNSTHN